MTAQGGRERLLTPSKVTAWLDCAHFLTLQHQVDDGVRAKPTGGMGEFAQLLMDKGLEHEQACLEAYRIEPGDVYEVPDRVKHESFSDWVVRAGDVLALGHQAVYQMPFVHEGMRGIADFLLRVDLPDGSFTYEPVDAKLARKEAKPGHALQLCFYAEAIEAQGLPAPANVHIWLGSGRVETIRLADIRAYWARIRKQLAVALEPAPEAAPSKPAKCSHCGFCAFAELCEAEWRAADALQFVAGIRSTESATLEADHVLTMAVLAEVDRPVAGLDAERQTLLTKQASLQVRARNAPDQLPPFELLAASGPEELALGLGALPAPDDGDVILDYEGHPFWRADTGLFFLFGLLTKQGADWMYDGWWAHDLDGEGVRTKQLIEYLAERRQQYPGMHVYHYNHTERSSLEQLAADHGADQVLLGKLVQTALFIDLLQVVRHGVIAGVESYGLKHMERFPGYERSHDIDAGAGAVVEYERFMNVPNDEALTRIAAYNEDDVRATLALREWLISLREQSMPWRAAAIEQPEHEDTELDEQVAALHEFPPDSDEYLMGDLLGYWFREGRANTAQVLAKLQKDSDELRADPTTIGGLRYVGTFERVGLRGKPLKWPGAEFAIPLQPIGDKMRPDRSTRDVSVCYLGGESSVGRAKVVEVDDENGRLVLEWNESCQELGMLPAGLALNPRVSPRPKPQSLSAIAAPVLAGDHTPSAAQAILSAAPPAFTAGNGPAAGFFTDEVEDVMRWALHLDHTCVPIQGPPGTGKTWMGAHLVHALVKAGQRVGITATSHHAIDNLLSEIVDVFTNAGDIGLLHGARKGAHDATPDVPQIARIEKNSDCASGTFNLVAATTWLFAGEDMAAAPVDVLIIDEAGQLGLADALAAARSAHNVILLGDPLQLPQVSQATHPGRSGASVLEHVLGPGVATVPPERGVFLTETRRMHPDVCRFISHQIYEGRLHWHESCELQGTDEGTGLRWLRAHHTDCSTESADEAALVVTEVQRLIGKGWTDADGAAGTLVATDFMVVAPYNDQVRLLRRAFDTAELHGVRVGTVDKFQGQQAPVVFFTMTTSTADDMPRDSGFLFSRNRLNVALSRARCLAYVVCTDELLNSRARTIEEMKLIATLCAAVDYAEAQG
ncbi:MAG: TM0106 family RecB-like putative nuclease [Actinobacteria bacterium]|nr:TM0106 family RecB-like putative nuclease [Actinomycetota bacterium]MSW79040.1 TM0106 family RecB-like putative nuclease [Actinomycetota bacterium]MSZ84731.1 TM0106 family RecB-like putative nuclease [Actinomycetota bacterium]MTB19408.1 TM0106 family RecB-like putative nuclease [Actinomycetota bacterium]